jgi:NAD(P) transhydrogenase subunit alpha
MLAAHCATVDVVITTALVGGVFAPKLITADMVKGMRPGSLIVDLGADAGGNCELSRPGETVEAHGVKIIAPTNLPARMPTHASLLFSRNMTAFIVAFTKAGAFQVDLSDEIQKGSLVAHQGEIAHPRVKDALKAAGPAAS